MTQDQRLDQAAHTVRHGSAPAEETALDATHRPSVSQEPDATSTGVDSSFYAGGLDPDFVLPTPADASWWSRLRHRLAG
ncbi:hypothetical protein [Zhihengliuella flava]|uniref:Uncharacterized protein n=1 Tax=Zhihengliuella flava TaxID=1285193 RepID=A0A931GEY8_9MICC|nr:hypothetical protein [Zhihengliuella flava]MBG6084650.1 hypothetical protein [Zhihengliuella flava]